MNESEMQAELERLRAENAQLKTKEKSAAHSPNPVLDWTGKFANIGNCTIEFCAGESK
ncbi:MAG: hypothetical protein ACLQMO_05335 [Acidobacteriaceae bacterium]